jgi:hypothetical protein
MVKLVLNPTHVDNLDEIEEWLVANVGKGSRRYRVNTWLGTDDWFLYEDTPELDINDQGVDDIGDSDVDTVVVFRREEDLILFSLRWS